MATSILRPTANRAVHLVITPRLSNLGESREVLRLVSQFGEIEYFKNLKYDALSAPAAALLIFKDEEAAKFCIRKSPIRFRMGKASVEEQPSDTADDMMQKVPSKQPDHTPSAPSHPAYSPFGLGQTRSMTTSSLPTPPWKRTSMPFEAPPPPLLESRIFQIQANSANADFRKHIDVGHYHGSFALDTKSIAQQDLRKSVPAAGLSCVDWRAQERPWRIVERIRERERKERKSLRQLYEEGQAFRDESLPG